jgi:hypothetical protein
MRLKWSRRGRKSIGSSAFGFGFGFGSIRVWQREIIVVTCRRAPQWALPLAPSKHTQHLVALLALSQLLLTRLAHNQITKSSLAAHKNSLLGRQIVKHEIFSLITADTELGLYKIVIWTT